MNGIATVRARARRLALIVAGIFALLGSSLVTAPAHAGYYEEGYNPCGYRCGYPVRHYYPPYRYHYGCYSCGRRLIYERRYVEREFVERRYGYGGGYRHYGYYPYRPRYYGYYPYRRHYGCNSCEGYRPSGYGYGYGGVGRRWPVPYADGDGPYAERYEDPPRPPAPIGDEGEY